MIQSLLIARGHSILPELVSGRGTTRQRRVVEGCSTQRHPEIVSGSTYPGALNYGFNAKINGQVAPVRVVALDEVDLPAPAPPLQLLFAFDGGGHVSEQFESHEPVDSVARREAREPHGTMLMETREEIRSHPDIERALRLAGENVDARLLVHTDLNSIGRAEKWMLKQVQHDEKEKVPAC